MVIATRDRAPELLGTLERMSQLPEHPRVVVVDNGSRDGTPDAVRSAFPAFQVVALPTNRGAAGRNIGARLATTAYVALSDDDSWWAPGALDRAVEILERNPSLALVAARVLVGPQETIDPTSVQMEASRPSPVSPGARQVLGFLGCGAVVRRDAYLSVGGFHPRLGIGGEEELLAMDLSAAGWELAYVPDVVCHHHPSTARDTSQRRRLLVRNGLWVVWLRLPLVAAVRISVERLAGTARQPSAWSGAAQALAGLPWIHRQRQVVPPAVEAARRRIRSDERDDLRRTDGRPGPGRDSDHQDPNNSGPKSGGYGDHFSDQSDHLAAGRPGG